MTVIAGFLLVAWFFQTLRLSDYQDWVKELKQSKVKAWRDADSWETKHSETLDELNSLKASFRELAETHDL